jgi:DNA-binding NarL/FixJ family response regulator
MLFVQSQTSKGGEVMPHSRLALVNEVNVLLAEGLSVADAADELDTTESALRLRLARLGFRLETKRRFVPWVDAVQQGGDNDTGL